MGGRGGSTGHGCYLSLLKMCDGGWGGVLQQRPREGVERKKNTQVSTPGHGASDGQSTLRVPRLGVTGLEPVIRGLVLWSLISPLCLQVFSG